MNKIITLPLNFTKVIKTASEHKKSPDIIRVPNEDVTIVKQTLENHIEYKASTKDFPLNNDVEKIFFMCNGIFPNDENFLNILAKHNFLSIFDEFIETYSYIGEKYKNNEKLAKMQKCMQYKKLMKVHSNEIVEIQNYFSKFHRITYINLIINKLLQIYYFNPELYNSYINNENKKLIKINKID